MDTPDDKPRHKPNTKHTLEEILKSLQDLIRNDLLETDAPPGTTAPGATAEPAPPHAPEGDLAALRHSLEHLVTEELRAEETSAAPPAAREPSQPHAPASPAAEVPAEGLQQELLFEALTPTAAPPSLPLAAPGVASAAPAPPPQSPAPQPPEPAALATAPTGVDDGTDTPVSPPPEEGPDTPGEAFAAAPEPPAADLDMPEPMSLAVAEAAAPTAASASIEAGPGVSAPGASDSALRSAGDWDDIPVLEDVVVDEPEPEAEPPAAQAAGVAAAAEPPSAPAAPATETNLALPLPAPSRAHDLAVKTVAKLNIELRKSGKRPLDPKVITRLAMMLREALESEAANVDNSPQP